MRYAALLVVATIPAGVIGVLFHRQIEERFHSLTWLGLQFIITGMMLWATRWSRGDRDLPSVAAAIGIGFGQAFATSQPFLGRARPSRHPSGAAYLPLLRRGSAC